MGYVDDEGGDQQSEQYEGLATEVDLYAIVLLAREWVRSTTPPETPAEVHRLKPRLQPDPAARLLILQRPRFGHLRRELALQ